MCVEVTDGKHDADTIGKLEIMLGTSTLFRHDGTIVDVNDLTRFSCLCGTDIYRTCKEAGFHVVSEDEFGVHTIRKAKGGSDANE